MLGGGGGKLLVDNSRPYSSHCTSLCTVLILQDMYGGGGASGISSYCQVQSHAIKIFPSVIKGTMPRDFLLCLYTVAYIFRISYTMSTHFHPKDFI